MYVFYGMVKWIEKSTLLPGVLAVVGSIIGGVITGLFMMWQNKKNFKYNLRLNELKDRKNEKAVLQALEAEIKADWQRYNEFIKPSIENLLRLDHSKRFTDISEYGNDLNYFYMLLSHRISISQDYFTIYNTNSSFIGKIKNAKLRMEIVSVYTNIKGFLELIPLNDNNKDKIEKVLKEDLEFALKQADTQVARHIRVTAYRTRLNELIEQLKQLKKHQDNLNTQIKKLTRLFEKEIRNINKELDKNKINY
jgi:CHAT domain-containing protein